VSVIGDQDLLSQFRAGKMWQGPLAQVRSRKQSPNRGTCCLEETLDTSTSPVEALIFIGYLL